jgi:proteasome lid subunit RPN8/RPN11
VKFSPYAWAKLIYLRDRGTTEVGGFGITDSGQPRFVKDIVLVSQSCTEITVAFDDTAVADYFDDQIDAGRHPEQFARIWIHTHPGNSAKPSGVDHETFARVFGNCDWAVMMILARNGETYAELKRTGNPRSEPLSVGIDFREEFPGSNQAAWENEYIQSVQEAPLSPIWDLDFMSDDAPYLSEKCPWLPT